MQIRCADLLDALDSRRSCEQSEDGVRIGTHCLYPSADQVFVHIAMWGDGYRITDGGGVLRSVLLHGRDDSALRVGLTEASNRHALRIEEFQLVAEVPDASWLPAAVAAVANGASMAAFVAIEHVTRRAEKTLKAKIFENISRIVPERHIAKDYEYRGKSGKSWKLDFAVTQAPTKPILLKAVTAHHNSISSNYTTFGDIGDHGTERFCVYQRQLSRDDAALMRQVATLAPVASIEVGVREALTRRMLS